MVSNNFLFWNRSSSFVIAFWVFLFALVPIPGNSQQTTDASLQSQSGLQTTTNRDKNCKIVYLGIVGGTEPSNNRHSGVVQLRDVFRGPNYPDVCAKTFTPYFWRSGFHWILTHFPSYPGPLTTGESGSGPKVILVGHSLGGWAVLNVARNLESKEIPVELCVQIDSVGITDHTVPRNVKAAAIFHANDAMFLLTTKKLKLEDPKQTKLVEDVLVKKAGHWSVTRDPRIKDLVFCTVGALDSSGRPGPSCPTEGGPRRPLISTDPPSSRQSQ